MSTPDPQRRSLSDQDVKILDLARQWWKQPAIRSGIRAQAMRDELDMTPGQFYVALNVLIDDEAALAADPLLVKHLRGLRGQRQRSRSVRRVEV